MKRKFFSGGFLRMKNILFFIVFLFFIFNFNVSKASIYIHSGEKCEGPGNSKLNIDYMVKGDQVYINNILVDNSITIDKLNKANTGCYFYSDSDILLTSSEIKTLINTNLTKYSEEFTKEYSQSVKENYTDKIAKIKINPTTTPVITELTKIIDNTKTYTGIAGTATPSFQSLYNDVLNIEEAYGFDDFRTILVRQRRIYLYKQLKAIKDKYQDLDKETLEIIDDMINKSYGGGSWNWSGPEKGLQEDEINPGRGLYGKVSLKGRDFPLTVNDQNEPIKDPETGLATQNSTEGQCSPTAGFWDTFIGGTNCSIIAYLVNLTLKGLTSIFGVFLTLAGKLLDWAIGFSIYNFSDLVANSGAYEVWRKVILALVTSLLLPLVFYYIIRMLIDNDTDKIQKILPKIIFTALFVYFSFTVVGFLIDQANILSIYIYRSLHSPDQSIASSMESLIIGDPSLKDPDAPGKGYSLGDWSAVPVMAIQLLMVGVGIMILFQAAILIFVRGVILILCLIFSPIMLLPSGIHSKIDEYRKKIIEYFTNSTIMAPVFLFLVLIAIKVGEAGSSIITNTDSLSTLSGTSTISGKLIGAAISGVISVIILQLAISTAKQLSGDIGNRISGKISSFIGNTALGGTARLTRMGASKLVNNKKFNGWISKGGTRGRLALKLQKSANNSTFDVRNNKTFAKATGNTFGKGSNTTINSAFEKRYAKEKEFYNRLNPEAQEKHIRNLRRGWTGTSIISNGNRVADRLEGKNSELSFKEKMDTNKNFKNKFDKANKETDTDKRMEKIYESIDSHFKANGKGEKYFTKQMKKEKYTEEFKEKLEKINKDKSLNEEERKNKILDIVNKFEEKKKEERENAGENTKDKKEKKKEKKAEKEKTDSSENKIKNNTNSLNNTTQTQVENPNIPIIKAQSFNENESKKTFAQAFSLVNFKEMMRNNNNVNNITNNNIDSKITVMSPEEVRKPNVVELKNTNSDINDKSNISVIRPAGSLGSDDNDAIKIQDTFTIPIGDLGKKVKKLKEQNK